VRRRPLGSTALLAAARRLGSARLGSGARAAASSAVEPSGRRLTVRTADRPSQLASDP